MLYNYKNRTTKTKQIRLFNDEQLNDDEEKIFND